jgi:putative intracellular protease/amidase
VRCFIDLAAFEWPQRLSQSGNPLCNATWGNQFAVDVPIDQARAEEYDGLLLPGGVMNPDHLGMNPQAEQFVKAFFVPFIPTYWP